MNPVRILLAGCSELLDQLPVPELPQDYGQVVEPVQCEAELVCDVAAAEVCMETLVFVDGCG